MIVIIGEGEDYPVFYLAKHGDECEVPEETVKDWERVTAENGRVQEEMRQVLEKTLGHPVQG